ncbi:MAG TPA: UDP-3-O-acyl-N-acetylglucosamine deacetylase [Gammaproteobacteria bacterium]|nr:UDP-3-O-acyl-N-acetylglucosamine deacetylase [Gammaproteobacteria bacterium]
MIKQRTLQTAIKATGIGLHTGEPTVLTLRPAPENTGIVFYRTDLPTSISIPARPENVGDTVMSTCLVKDGVRIATIEHLMSALAGLGIDNAYIDVSASEIPIMDGSSGPFVYILQSAGIKEQNAPKKFIRIKRKITVRVDDKYATFEPYEGFKVSLSIDFNHPLFHGKPQEASIDFSTTSYVKEVSRARTFGFISEYEYLRSRNLALGASMDNAIVIDDYKILNDGGLRYEDELVKHKILDAVGDLYLLGSIIGSFSGYKSGHALNNKLLRELLADQTAYEIVTFEDKEAKSPILYPVLHFA